MSLERLKSLVDQLHAELRDVASLDVGARQRLAELMDDIQAVMPAESSLNSHAVGDRWRRLATQFEAEHPQLMQTVSKVSEALAQLGI